MTTPIQAPSSRNRDETEAWILSVLDSKDPLPLKELLDILNHFGKAGLDRRVDGWAELVQDTLTEQGNALGMLDVLALRCQWYEQHPEFKDISRKAVENTFTDRLGKVLLKHVGFNDAQVPAHEAVRRMQLLAHLKKGVLCLDKTWGFGIVKRMDDFYAKVTLDFDRKRNHEMVFSYAAESLTILSEDHLLARIHRNKQDVETMAQQAPAELVKLTLQSYGPLNVEKLKDTLCAVILEEASWKRFWDAARKDLKTDPLVHIPQKRSDNLLLMESANELEQQEFEALSQLRTPDSILKQIDAMDKAGHLADLKGDHHDRVANRLAFAIWGSEDMEKNLLAKALLTAERLDLIDADETLGGRPIDRSSLYRKLLDDPGLPDRLSALPSRLMTLLLERSFQHVPDLALQRLLDVLTHLSVPVLQAIILAMQAPPPFQQALKARIQECYQKQKAGPALLFVLLRDSDLAISFDLLDTAEHLRQSIEALERPASGELLKAQHMLRGLFEDGTWLSTQFSKINAEQREVILLKIMTSAGWDERGRRAVIAGIIKDWPDLQSVISVASETPEIKPRARMTSWRSYRERQQQFQHLMEVEIPENAREIGVARSYGDLRENAEFKYAKEHQRILYRRRDELEIDLENVRGTHFEGSSTETVGMGTEVVIRRPDGQEQRYRILGEWDRDEQLNIISSLSQIARTLEGCRVGDSITLPGLTGGEETCEILSIEPLGQAALDWMQQEPLPNGEKPDEPSV